MLTLQQNILRMCFDAELVLHEITSPLTCKTLTFKSFTPPEHKSCMQLVPIQLSFSITATTSDFCNEFLSLAVRKRKTSDWSTLHCLTNILEQRKTVSFLCESENWVTTCCSVAQSCLTLCDPMDCSTPGFPVLHHLPELARTHVHWVSDAIQPSHPLSPPSPSALKLFQQQGHF